MSIKGDRARPNSTTREERNLRWRLVEHKITFIEYEIEYKKLKKRGLIKRNGRTL